MLVTGGGGMLARDVAAVFRARGAYVSAPTRGELDVVSRVAVRSWMGTERPDIVVQCAAYTAVDAAETNADLAFRVNATATEHVAAACNERGTLLVYPSTDYVFRGDATRPYRPNDPTDPVNTYGRSKEAGERAALTAENAIVVRTSWLYGGVGPNFVRTILRRAEENVPLRVVEDQVGRPTWSESLATVIAELVAADAHGIFHGSDGGESTSWFGFAKEILRMAGAFADIEPVTTSAWPAAATRPAFSVLDCASTEVVLGRAIPDWRLNLEGYLRSWRGAA